ncbi:MAG: hypothetical protein VKK04_10420 [Synechococcales bacterium]|nr:hypothetical protein [Synechococcales bacterium]
MAESVKDRVTQDLQRAKQEGKLRSERIRDIVKEAVAQAVGELKGGTSELRLVVKDAIAAVIDVVRDRGSEAKEDIQASVEGVLEGVNSTRRQAIAQIESQMEQLQEQIDSEETRLEEQTSLVLSDIEETGEETKSAIGDTVQSVVTSIRNSPEVALMKKRYAQLRAQLALLRANLSAEEGTPEFDRVNRYLEDARSWYERMRAEPQPKGAENSYLAQKQASFEAKMSEAGGAVARKEAQVKQVLRDLWKSFTDLSQEEKSSGSRDH